MKIKNMYEPDEEDLLEWNSHPEDGWPESDWDMYVMDGGNDEIVFRFANDLNCAKRLFFLHCLYYFVGGYYVGKYHSLDERTLVFTICNHKRLMKLLGMVNAQSAETVVAWKVKTLKLLAHEINFDSTFWFNYMFLDDIKKLDDEQAAGDNPA
ncbi:hypothetical protein QMK33_22770 [Hymenobacter sp. H14-R3]|uniref:hypothetical protein n=1 Tax=Hymenobacter sp. H14-R3 TaxID=3046308 RepID=UPI0024B99EE5|nr:hypothetical protein [Hymenobacter sp. H14-R3]MDJ0367975.1 hypothetical protein [Hymenobacter sp. H14-R3]